MTNAIAITNITAATTTIYSTTSIERISGNNQKNMMSFDTKGNMTINNAGKFYSNIIADGDLVSVEIPYMEDSAMIAAFRRALNNGIIISGDKWYALNADHTTGCTLAPKDKMEVHTVVPTDETYEICWVSPSQINSKSLLFCKAEKRKDFERKISCGYIHENLKVGSLKDIMSFVIRMNSCSGAKELVPNSTTNDIGVIVLRDKPKYRDGQFYGYFPQLKNNTAYQFRVFMGAGKGMLLNSKKLFKKHIMKAMESGNYDIVGNPNNIVAVMDRNSYKLDPSMLVSGSCWIMAEAHTSDANATTETVKVLVQKGYDKNTLQKKCEDELLNAVHNAIVAKDGDYILQAFAGATKHATTKLVENALQQSTFEFGAKYVKLLQADDNIINVYKAVDGKKYPCVDATGINEGLTLLERKPSTSMAESVVVYNMPGCYGNIFTNTVMLPSGEVGLDIATCLGGADYDGDGVFIGHDSTIVKTMIENGYESKTIEVVGEKAANVEITSYAHLLFFLYTQEAANINRVVGTFKKFQFATQKSLYDAFIGTNEISVFGNEISSVDIDEACKLISAGVKMESREDIELLRKTIMEIARYMGETEIAFGKKGVHAPANVFAFFATKAKEMKYDPKYDIDWESANRIACDYARDYFENTRLLNKADVTMTTAANNIAKAMANVMRAKMHGCKMAALGFDAMIRANGDAVLTMDCIRAAYSRGYEANIMTDECLEALGYEVIDKHYDLNAVTVNIGRRVEKASIGTKVRFGVDEKGRTWMSNSKSKALVLGPMPNKEEDVYEIIDIFNCDPYTTRDGKTLENTVVVLKKV